MSGSLWIIVVFIGAFALVGAIAYAALKNRVSPRQEQRTEEATRRLYEEGTTDESVRNR